MNRAADAAYVAQSPVLRSRLQGKEGGGDTFNPIKTTSALLWGKLSQLVIAELLSVGTLYIEAISPLKTPGK